MLAGKFPSQRPKRHTSLAGSRSSAHGLADGKAGFRQAKDRKWKTKTDVGESAWRAWKSDEPWFPNRQWKMANVVRLVWSGTSFWGECFAEQEVMERAREGSSGADTTVVRTSLR